MASEASTQARAWFSYPSLYLGFVVVAIIAAGGLCEALIPLARAGTGPSDVMAPVLILGVSALLATGMLVAVRRECRANMIPGSTRRQGDPYDGFPPSALGGVAGLVLAMACVTCTPTIQAASIIQMAQANVRNGAAFLGRAPAIRARVDGDSVSLAVFSRDAAFMQSVAEASADDQQVMQSLLAARALGVALPFVTDNGMLRPQDTALLRKVALAAPGNPVAAAWLGRQAETLAVATH